MGTPLSLVIALFIFIMFLFFLILKVYFLQTALNAHIEVEKSWEKQTEKQLANFKESLLYLKEIHDDDWR